MLDRTSATQQLYLFTADTKEEFNKAHSAINRAAFEQFCLVQARRAYSWKQIHHDRAPYIEKAELFMNKPVGFYTDVFEHVEAPADKYRLNPIEGRYRRLKKSILS